MIEIMFEVDVLFNVVGMVGKALVWFRGTKLVWFIGTALVWVTGRPYRVSSVMEDIKGCLVRLLKVRRIFKMEPV